MVKPERGQGPTSGRAVEQPHRTATRSPADAPPPRAPDGTDQITVKSGGTARNTRSRRRKQRVSRYCGKPRRRARSRWVRVTS
jgi:hypothetical protein